MSLVDQDGKVIPPAQPEKPAIRVCLAVPSGDLVQAGFMFDFATLVGATALARRDIDLRICTRQATIIHAARRDLVRRALETDCTHIMFFDADMRFPRNTLLRLLSHGRPIVGANYSTRAEPTFPVSFANDQSDKEKVYTEVASTGLQVVDSTGFGVMLIDLDVFRALPEPWFSFEWKTPKHMVGEDVYFCRKAKAELGIETLIDHDLSKEVKHIGIKEYTTADALVTRALAEEEAARAGLGTADEVN